MACTADGGHTSLRIGSIFIAAIITLLMVPVLNFVLFWPFLVTRNASARRGTHQRDR